MRREYNYLSFTCPTPGCGHFIRERELDLPGYDYTAEVHSEGAGVVELDITCPICETDFRAEITNMMGHYEAVLLEKPATKVKIVVPDEPDDQDDYEAYLASFFPEDPIAAYRMSAEQLDIMLRKLDPHPFEATFNQMLFVQHIVIMEAYLTDRLLTLVTGNKDVCKAFVMAYQPLKAQKYTLEAFTGHKDLVTDRAAAFVKSQLYHDMDVVDGLYTAALGSSVFIDADHKKFLTDAMIRRHDSVHRNGKDIAGVRHQPIDKKYVEDLSAAIYQLVDSIESSFAKVIEDLDR